MFMTNMRLWWTLDSVPLPPVADTGQFGGEGSDIDLQ